MPSSGDDLQDFAFSAMARQSQPLSSTTSRRVEDVASNEERLFEDMMRTSSQFLADDSRLNPARMSLDAAKISCSRSQSVSVFAEDDSSSTAWKLVPPKPRAEHAARRG